MNVPVDLSGYSDEELLIHALRGDKPAFRFARMITQIFSTWDGALDNKTNADEINSMMWNALVELQANPFYQKFSQALQPVIQSAILNRHLSRAMMRTPGRSREVAHVMRYAAADVITYAAGLLGDVEWARYVGVELRLRAQKEDFAQFDSVINEANAAAASVVATVANA